MWGLALGLTVGFGPWIVLAYLDGDFKQEAWNKDRLACCAVCAWWPAAILTAAILAGHGTTLIGATTVSLWAAVIWGWREHNRGI